MKLFVAILFFIFEMGCTSNQVQQKNIGSNEKKPIRSLASLTKIQLSEMKPTDLINLLKQSCCTGVMIERTDVSFWGEAEIESLQKMVGDSSECAPVMTSESSVLCSGKKFASTVDRETRHLIKAIRQGTYPISFCSTYDLDLD